jgi:hypothetical protein
MHTIAPHVAICDGWPASVVIDGDGWNESEHKSSSSWSLCPASPFPSVMRLDIFIALGSFLPFGLLPKFISMQVAVPTPSLFIFGCSVILLKSYLGKLPFASVVIYLH